MKKKGYMIGGIILAVVVIGLLVFFGVRNKNCKYQDLGKIQSMKYFDGKQELELVKEDEQWYWEDRKDLLLDNNFVEMQAKIAGKKLGIQKTEDKGSLKKYGLKDTTYSLTLKDSKGRTITIHIGDMLSEDTYFVKVGNEKSVYTASWQIMEVINSLMAQRTNSEDMIYIGE